MTTSTNVGENQSQGNPDLKFCVWPKAFDETVQTIVDCVFQERALNELYRSGSEFLNVVVSEVVKPKFCIAIDQGKLTWTLDNSRFTICADQPELTTARPKNFAKRVSGSFTVDVTVTPTDLFKKPSFNVCINLSGNASSQQAFRLSDLDTPPSPSPDESDGDQDARDTADFDRDAEYRLQLHDTESDIHGRKRSWVCVDPTSEPNGEPDPKRRRLDPPAETTDRLINNSICDCLLQAFADGMLEKLNGSLPVYALPSGASNDWLVSFSEMSLPEFQNGLMVSNHLSGLCHREETIRAPMPAAAFPEPQNSDRMLTIFISNCVINTIGYHLHQQNILNYNLTQADLIPQATEDSSTTETAERSGCLSDCFPDFSEKYPGASMEVNMISTEAPTAKFSDQSLKVTLMGSAIFRAHLPDGKLVDCLKTAVTLETTVEMTLDIEELAGTVTSVLPTSISIVESALNSANDEVLRKVFDLIAEQFLSRKFEEITQKGIPLPPPLIPGVLQYENIEIQAEEEYLRFDTDVIFSE